MAVTFLRVPPAGMLSAAEPGKRSFRSRDLYCKKPSAGTKPAWLTPIDNKDAKVP